MAEAKVSPGKKEQPEKDIIRSAFRAMNIQAVLALMMIIIFPYFIAFRFIDTLVSDVTGIARGFAGQIYEEFAQDPGRETAMRLAVEHSAIIGFEGGEGFWYTEGETITEIMPGMRRPYYRGLYRYFDTPGGERFIICWPLDFFVPELHIQVFLTWAGAPILFFLMLYFLSRRTLYPLRWMQTGINEITSGNLKYVAPVTGRDKKNTLAKKFNRMTASIRELIHSKDQLIMDVSHELRSPVTRIKVALEMLPEDEKTRLLRKNVNELEEIITAILESQRINLRDIETDISPCRLSDVIRDCVDLHRNPEPGFQLEVDDSLVMDGDRSLLKLLIHNLLDNALKYSLPDSKPVLIRLYEEGECVYLEIIDDGIGIAEEHLQRVFEPFYKVASERGFNSGYGLGLSLCRRIAELHGGDIRLENQQPGGLKVILRFDYK